MKGFETPQAQVVDETAVVPDANLIKPAPNQFTHQLSREEPYFYQGAQRGRPPDGTFSSGTKVVLMVYDGGAYCRVADSRGLYVETGYEALANL